MKLVRTALVVAAAALVSLAPTAANADSYTQVDATGDLQQTPIQGTGSYTPAPDRVDGDVAYTTVSHRKRVIRVKIAFRELTQAGPNAEFLRIKSNRLNREIDVLAFRGKWQGTSRTQTFTGKKARCSVRKSIDYTANKVVINVPRSCLGNPRWVRVAIGAGTYTDSTTYADDARASGLPNYYVFGPKIRR